MQIKLTIGEYEKIDLLIERNRKPMKLVKFFSVISVLLFSITALYASADTSISDCEKSMLNDPFLKITEKVIVFLKDNPSKNNLSIRGLLMEEVINEDDYNFLLKHNIKYNPPSSAGPYDNYMSLFDRENEDGTITHMLYDLVDKSDPSITKTGNISSLNRYLTEWYEFKSDNKSLFIFNNEDFYYYTIWYTNNEHWDKQHGMMIDFPETNKEDIKKIKNLLQAKKIKYREYVAQSDLNLDVMLPSDLSVIKDLCAEILVKIFSVKPNNVINYTPHGFRFKKD